MTTYYVNGSIGSDSYDGLSSTVDGGGVGPYATLTKAAQNAQTSGDTVLVADGNYKGFNSISGGTSGAPITYSAENKWGAVIKSAATNTSHGISIASVFSTRPWWPKENGVNSYITIDGFKIQDMNPTYIPNGRKWKAIELAGTEGIHIRNCYFYNCWDGIQGPNNRLVHIEHNVFDYVGQASWMHAIYMSEGVDCYPLSGTWKLSGYNIHHNTFRNIADGADPVIHFQSHTIWRKFSGVTIWSNDFNVTARTITPTSMADAHIYNNVLVDYATNHGVINMGSPGQYGICVEPDDPYNIHIYNNTIIGPNKKGVYWRYTSADGPLTTSGCTCFNNIIFANTLANTIVDNSQDPSLNFKDARTTEGGSNYCAAYSTEIMDATFQGWRNGNYQLRESYNGVPNPAVQGGVGTFHGITAPSLSYNTGTTRPQQGRYDIGAHESPYPETPSRKSRYDRRITETDNS